MRQDRHDVVMRPRTNLVLLGIACLAVVATLAVSLRYRLLAAAPAEERLARAAASLSYRASEARLSGETVYRPAVPQLRGALAAPEATKNLEFLAVAAEVESNDTVDDIHAGAVAKIYLHEPEIAVARIQEALQRAAKGDAKQQASLWNDLAVARLELAAEGERRLLVSALDAAERAWAADDTSLSIAWTRAVLLEKLINRRAALAAWREYLRLDEDSAWALEARKHAAAVAEPPSLAEFTPAGEAQLRMALLARDDVRAAEIVGAFPQDTRLYGEEELLPRWADLHSRRLPADETLAVARELGKTLVANTGESLLADAIAQIDAADAATRGRIAAALLEYKAARDLYRAKQFEPSRQRLGTAEAALKAVNSPMAIWANVYRTAATYSGNRFGAAVDVLESDIDPCRSERRYYAACGVKSWIQGLALVQSGHPAASLESYERGLAASRAANETGLVATLLALRADTLDFMSATDEAWADRMAALEMFAKRPMSARPLIWMTIAQAALRDHEDRAAAIIMDEIAADARANGDSMWIAEGMLWRLIATDRLEGQLDDNSIDVVRAAIAHIENPAIRARSQANLGLVLAEVRGGELAARGELDHALEFYRSSDDQFNGTAALTQRAAVRATAADFEAANADVVAALEEFRRQSEEISDPLTRTLLSERSRELSLSLSKLQVARGKAYAALWFSDRARQTAVRTFHGEQESAAASEQDAESRARMLVRSIPSRVAVIHQDLDGDELRTWAIRDGEAHLIVRTVNGSLLRAELAGFRSQLKHDRSEEELMPAARRLYDVLLRPAQETLGGALLMVYSPCPELRGVPAGVLHDGETFVFERVPVAVTRSLDSVARVRLRPSGNTASVLLVNGAPEAGAQMLEGVEHEADALTRWYGPRAQVLRGVAATPDAVLTAAPRYDIIHLGAHGRTDRRPLQNAMELDSGRRLRAFEIMNLSLPKAPVVVLGGCSTDDETTGRATLSLANAFADAGAAAVIGSLWDVEDIGAMRVLVKFHKELGTSVSVCEALRRAQLLARRNQEPPAVWAAFQVHI